MKATKERKSVKSKPGKLFKDFCKEAYKSVSTDSAIVDLRNIYNAASVLPYEKWLIVVAGEYGNSRYKKA